MNARPIMRTGSPVLIWIAARSRRSLMAILCVASLFVGGCESPPTARLDEARAELRNAYNEDALRYAESSYREAESIMNAGWQELSRQNGRLGPLRDYRVADSLLRKASEQARKTRKIAHARRDSLESTYRDELQAIKTEMLDWELALNGSLAKTTLQRYLHAAELAANTGERLGSRREYAGAAVSLADARASLVRLSQELDRYARADTGKTALWRTWVDETIQESRTKKTHAVIVDKSAHKLYLIRAGHLIKTFDCNLGYNSARQKLFAGDGATPEGRYRVTVMKPTGSKYYKALLLDFPNARDRARFTKNRTDGVISAKAKIGGLIEIHGHGGRDRDWTEGCVALADTDMDTLMKVAKTGMAVTIVRISDRWP